MNKFIITELKRQKKALSYSLAGLKSTWCSEISFKIELILAFLFIAIIYFLDITLLEKSALFFAIMLVLIVEIINTAIENTLSLISKEYNPVIKVAKDQGSAAVLLAIINMIVIWTLILIN